MRKTLFPLFLLLPCIACGCLDKETTITFHNRTGKVLEVALRGPGEGTGLLGAMEANDGMISTMVTQPKSKLPSAYAWDAGDHCGRFVITRETQRVLDIVVGGKE
jgi:hypothetical protein